MTRLSDRSKEKAIIKRIRRLVDTKGVQLAAIAMECKIDKGTVRALYEDRPNSKIAVSATTAAKVEEGLDRYETRLGMTKKCATCGNLLPYGKFYNHRGNSDGLYYQCKDCKRKQDDAAKQQKAAEKNKKEVAKVNGGKDKPVTKEIVNRVKAEDQKDVDAKFMAAYFGISPKQLEEVRQGKWDSLLLTPKIPEKAETVLASVEKLRGEVAELRREIETLLIELGVKVDK